MTGAIPGAATLSRACWAMFAMLGIVALFLFVDRTTMPIVLWDESRNVVNALEMQARGWSVVTTYGGAPDLWNTKPPLLIWAMQASVDLFGGSVGALRLPSALAALATFALLMRHVRRSTGSLGTALLAAALLALSPAMFGEHSARTADYDALLLAFTTAYCCLGFAALRRRRPGGAVLIVAGATVAGAILTKSIAGLVPGVGLAVFALATGRWRRMSGDGRYLLGLAAALVPVAVFAVARETAGPGYLAVAWHNDVAGRFGSAVVGVERPWTFYLSDLAAGYFAAPLLLLAAPLAWRAMSARERLAATHAAAICIAVLVVVSVAASKLHHYILSAMPFMAALAAIVARVMWRELRVAWAGERRLVATVFALILALSAFSAVRGAVVLRYLAPQVGEGARSGGYGALFGALGQGSVTVVDPGFVNEGRPGYAPVLRAYRLLARQHGLVVRRAATVRGAENVGSCDPAIVTQLARIGRVIVRTPGCIAVRMAP